MVRCPTRVDLERFLDGSGTEEERRRIEVHRASCPTCERWLSEAGVDEDLCGDLGRVLRELAPEDSTSDGLPPLPRYRILRRLGAGGMGVVYEAEQRSPRRRVALKLLRPGFVSRRALARFEHEADVLARLDHPCIARILEADTIEVRGATQPFFAMELVEGRPLDEHAAGLPLRERLRLFVDVCEAVQHAHRKGIVHRDLKPRNVLVDAGGAPRVLDFGIARTIDDEELRDTLRSRTGEVLGTLPYMSPEQVSGRSGEVDTRTDVYALGVMLYELCSGRLPFDLAGASLPEAARIVSEQPAAPLADVDRDLRTIAAKALEKDAERRYPSVAALAEDVRRYLDDRPIEARPPSAVYQLAKYARRNRAVVAGAAAALALLVAGVVATALQAIRATRAEELASERARIAEAESEAARAANRFLYEILGNDGSPHPEDYTVREALELAEHRLAARRDLDPRVEATIRVALGSNLHRQGEFEAAERHLRAAVELREAVYGPDHPATAGALNELAVMYDQWNHLEEAAELYDRALVAYRASGAGESPEAGTALSNLGNLELKRGRPARAEDLLLQGVAVLRRHAAEYPEHLAHHLSMLASVLVRRGEPEQAEARLREAVAVLGQGGGEHGLEEARTRVRLADLLMRQERIDEAIEHYRGALELRIAGRMSRTDRDFVGLVNRLAGILDDLGLAEEAEEVRAELR